MTGPFPMALLAAVASIGLWGTWLLGTARTAATVAPGIRLTAFLVGLPMSALVNILVKAPVGWLWFGDSRTLTWGAAIFFLFFGALAEEAMKLVPAMFRPLGAWAASRRAAALTIGGALGLGFGVGEIAFLAVGIAADPTWAATPAWMFTGFLGERLAACLAHVVLTAVAVTLLARRRRGVLGLSAATGLHALLNVGAMAYQMKVTGAALATLWLGANIILLVFILERLRAVAARRLPPRPGSEAVLYRRPGNGSAKGD